jgi:hypothetical protein
MSGIMLPYMSSMGQMGYVAPSTIPNLDLWFNASASSTVVNGVSTNNFDVAVTNGTSIKSWINLFGSSPPSNVNGGGTREPNYATPIQNGLGAILYTAANSENLDINPAGAWSTNKTGMTIYVIARPTSLPATVFPLTVSETFLGIWWNGTNWSCGQSSGNFGTATVTNDTTKFHIYGFLYDGIQSTNAAKLQFRYDRTGQSLTYTGTIGANTGSPAYWFFGGDNRGAAVNATFTSTYMSGYIAEVLIWTRTLNSVEIGSVELYLKSKWGLNV